jgi:hypothetical protein
VAVAAVPSTVVASVTSRAPRSALTKRLAIMPLISRICFDHLV